jgi:hypothetical protein
MDRDPCFAISLSLSSAPMFHYVAPALTSGGQPVQFEYQVLPSISIHNNFSPSAPSVRFCLRLAGLTD